LLRILNLPKNADELARLLWGRGCASFWLPL
jgi:hypothetical protein